MLLGAADHQNIADQIYRSLNENWNAYTSAERATLRKAADALLFVRNRLENTESAVARSEECVNDR